MLVYRVRRMRSRRRGFTMIELLTVVLILDILMSVALPYYISAVQDAEKKTCRSNLQSIANAVQAAKVRTRAATYFTGTVNAAACGTTGTLADLSQVPKCPNGGTYTVNTSTLPYTVHCNVPAHEDTTGPGGAGFTPGVDNR